VTTADGSRGDRPGSLALLAGALGLLVSLYLLWRTATCRAQEYFGAPVSCDPLNLFSSQGLYEGIETSVGHVAGLFAVLLIFLAAASLVRPRLARRLPLGRAALAASYFTLAVGLESRSDARDGIFDSMYAYGAYVGLAAGLIVLFAALWHVEELAALPAALLALAAVDLFAQREAIRWSGGAVVGLCVLLAILGRVEYRQGLEKTRIPNGLRLDRL
jgi:hypothetical protein